MNLQTHHADDGGHATTPLREFLAFKLGDEEYGIDILRVQEIRSYEPPTRLANAPDFVKGVVDLRGVVWEHGLPYDDREYSLDGRGIRRKESGGIAAWSCADPGVQFEVLFRMQRSSAVLITEHGSEPLE